MKSTLLLLLLFVVGSSLRAEPAFRMVDIVLDSGEVSVAAYQFELTFPKGEFEIVGIERADLPGKRPPIYDPKGLRSGRIIIAQFSTAAAETLPSGKVRLARLHVMTADPAPAFTLKLLAAAQPGGKRIEGKLSHQFVKRKTP